MSLNVDIETKYSFNSLAGQSGADYLSCMVQALNTKLLSNPVQTDALRWRNRDSDNPILLLCEHAGQTVPEFVGDIPAHLLNSHYGWDIGAAELAMRVADKLSAPLIMQRYSRLVIDCNRPPGSDGSIPSAVNGELIDANQHLSAEAIAARRHTVFDPLDDAIKQGFESASRAAAFSIHSYTRQFENDNARPWDAGLLGRADMDTADALMKHLQRLAPGKTIALNQPYQIEDGTDWFIPVHAEARGVKHTLIEICNDQLNDTQALDQWAEWLATAIEEVTGVEK